MRRERRARRGATSCCRRPVHERPQERRADGRQPRGRQGGKAGAVPHRGGSVARLRVRTREAGGPPLHGKGLSRIAGARNARLPMYVPAAVSPARIPPPGLGRTEGQQRSATPQACCGGAVGAVQRHPLCRADAKIMCVNLCCRAHSCIVLSGLSNIGRTRSSGRSPINGGISEGL